MLVPAVYVKALKATRPMQVNPQGQVPKLLCWSVSFNTLPLFFPFFFPPFLFNSLPPSFSLLCSLSLSLSSLSPQIYEAGDCLRIGSKRKQFQSWHQMLCRLVPGGHRQGWLSGYWAPGISVPAVFALPGTVRAELRENSARQEQLQLASHLLCGKIILYFPGGRCEETT